MDSASLKYLQSDAGNYELVETITASQIDNVETRQDLFRKIASGLHGYGHANTLTYDGEAYTFERCYEQDEVWCFEFVGAGARLVAEQYPHGYSIVLVEPMG